MGSVFLSYKINGGLLNLHGIGASSISSKNGDWKADPMASIVALQCLCRSGEIESVSTKSHDLSLDRQEPDWWDASPRLPPTLTNPSGNSPRFLLRCLPRTSNSRFLKSLRKHSKSWPSLSRCLCLKTLDANWYVCDDPFLEPECSSPHSYLLSLFLLCLLSRQLEPRDKPPKPLPA